MTNSKMVTQLEGFLTVALGSGTMDANYSMKKSTKMKKIKHHSGYHHISKLKCLGGASSPVQVHDRKYPFSNGVSEGEGT